MAFMVVCAGVKAEFISTYQLIEFHEETWKRMLLLALDHGWKPGGTVPDPVWAKTWKKWGFDSNYKCEDYGKMVSDADAAGIADALERALADSGVEWAKISGAPRPALMSDSFDDRQVMRANRGVDPALVKEMIGFLRKGWFSFCWDD
jgi:hypothetical protein